MTLDEDEADAIRADAEEAAGDQALARKHELRLESICTI
jgi:hypothetical protein